MAVFPPSWSKEQMQSQMKIQQILRVKFEQVYSKTYVDKQKAKKKKKLKYIEEKEQWCMACFAGC